MRILKCIFTRLVRLFMMGFAVFLMLYSASSQAQTSIRFPSLPAYSNAMSSLWIALDAADYSDITNLINNVLTTTRDLNKEILTGVRRCRAAVFGKVTGISPSALFQSVNEAYDGMRIREVAGFHARLLLSNYEVMDAELVSMMTNSIVRSIATLHPGLDDLHAALTQVDGKTLPPLLVTTVFAPDKASHGEVVDLRMIIYNAGDIAASHVYYRLVPVAATVEPAPTTSKMPDIPGGTERRHVFYVRMPENGPTGAFTISVAAGNAPSFSAGVEIKLEDK